MRNLARQDPQGWRSKSADERVLEAARVAMADIKGEADLKVHRANLQIIKTAAMGQRVGDLMASYAIGRSKALVKEMEHTDNYAEGIKRETMSNLMDLLDAVGSKQGTTGGRKALMFLFDAENPMMTRDLATEIFENGAGSTGNTMARAAAKAWLESIEQMRARFNGAGGDVGQLDYGYLPQPHDQARVRRTGDGAARDKWVQDTLPLLDRNRYFQEDGTPMTDVQMEGVLGAAWETIATGGLNKMTPGQGGGNGSRANAGSESRQIHFKDADAYMKYMGDYGGGSMYDAMLGHIGGMSRDIALVERYGPNPAQQMKLQFDLTAQAEGRPVSDLPRSFLMKPQSYWDLISGKTGMAENGNLARIGQDLRNIQVFGKLAGAVLSSVTDVGTFFVTTGFNRLSYFEAMKNIGKQFDGNTRDFLTMHGVIADSMISNLNRWSGDNIKNNWSGRLANSTMKLSLMNAWTDTMRRAFSMTMMGGLAKMSKTEWKALSEWDRTHMIRKGITEADWEVIRTSQLTSHQGADFLTPESIHAGGHPRANEVVAKVLGLITDESEYAVINPDLATKSAASWGGKSRGTITGEMARATMQFKSFPFAMISRHWRRMLDAPVAAEGAPGIAAPFGKNAPQLANRLMYGASMLVSLTALGAIAFQTKQLVQGKDPADMTTPKFWTRAGAQGGGLGIVGDFLFTDPTESPGDAVTGAMKNVAGPTMGSAFDIGFKLGMENIYESAHGKDTHFAAEAIRTTRAHLPYVNLWYAKAALDHAGLHALQENLSPGYLSKMQKRARKDWGQEYWWEPGTGAPDRAPDLSSAGGK
jgi:hypothetical protein